MTKVKPLVVQADINWGLKVAKKHTYHKERKTTKRNAFRERVWLKFNKHCAYCGKELEYKDMQVDHMWPKTFGGNSEIINLMPPCRRCNHYKRANNINVFRRLMNTLHQRISNLYIGKVAIDYGIITVKPFNGLFYFEKTTGTRYEDIDLKDLLVDIARIK